MKIYFVNLPDERNPYHGYSPMAFDFLHKIYHGILEPHNKSMIGRRYFAESAPCALKIWRSGKFLPELFFTHLGHPVVKMDLAVRLSATTSLNLQYVDITYVDIDFPHVGQEMERMLGIEDIFTYFAEAPRIDNPGVVYKEIFVPRVLDIIAREQKQDMSDIMSTRYPFEDHRSLLVDKYITKNMVSSYSMIGSFAGLIVTKPIFDLLSHHVNMEDHGVLEYELPDID